MTLEIVTYANKSHGLFEQLVHNKFGVKVVVLGMGTEWKGFQDKFDGMTNYLKTKNEDDIVVFLDGFDSLIVKDPVNLEKIFKSYDCKILASKDPEKQMGWFMFGSCRGHTANSGMYMGYVKELRQLMREANDMTCTDDMVNLNTFCRNHDYVKVDVDCLIFENIVCFDPRPYHDSIFVSYPASPTPQRYSRAFHEYYQFFIEYIAIALVVVVLVVPRRYKWIPLLACAVSAVIYYTFADRSCV